MSGNREKEVWKELDRLTFLASIVAIVILVAIYFIIGEMKPSEESIWNTVKVFVQDIIINLIPVFLLFMGSYAVFRRIQTLRSERETEDLASKVAFKVVEVLRETNTLTEDAPASDETPTMIRKSPISTESRELLEKIEFDYSDSPTEHGWRVVECLDETQVVPTHFDDGFAGKAIKVRSTVSYAMDYDVKPPAVVGSIVEFVVELEDRESAIYACFSLQSSDGSTSKPGHAYFNVQVGKGQPIPHGDDSIEWILFVEPAPPHLGGGWVRLPIDLDEAVEQTFGRSGWKLGRLIGFRLRGNLSLAHISVFKAK